MFWLYFVDDGHVFVHVVGGVVGDESCVYYAIGDGFQCGDEVVFISAAFDVGLVVEADGDVVLGWEA